MNLPNLLQKAKRVLDDNWTGRYTKPSATLYPHQWNWDSGFIAIGYAHFHQARAKRELLSLFKGQWGNGMLPHIVFHQTSDDYFPGASVWESGLAVGSPRGVPTSGLTQPPIQATAVRAVWDAASDKPAAFEFLEALFPKLIAAHRFLHACRDPMGEGLAACVHPWETGADNAPLWDTLLGRLGISPLDERERKDLAVVPREQRPSGRSYGKFLHLVELFKELRYDQARVVRRSPFLVYDVLFNSVLLRADHDLRRIAEILGAGTTEIETWISRARHGFERILWHPDDGVHHSFDVRAQQPLRLRTASCSLPLFAELPGPSTASRIEKLLTRVCPFHEEDRCVAIPSYDESQPGFSPENYWRGPVWVNVNWMIHKGLLAYGFQDLAGKIRLNLLRLVDHLGFHEYFCPNRPRGLGSDNFSWSAALAVDLIESS